MKFRSGFFYLLIVLNCIGLSAQDDNNIVYIFKKHNQPVYAVAFSDDETQLASGGEDKSIYVWDINSGELKFTLANNYFPIRDLKFADTDEILAACGPDIKLMDFDGNLIRTFSGNTTHIWSFDFNAETNKIVSGSYATNIRVWYYDTGETFLILEGHEKSTLPVAISPDGKYIISGSLDRSVRVWNAATGAELKKLDMHTDNIYSVKFHPGGKYIASASGDKTIRLWDFVTGEVIKTYAGHENNVMDIDFSPDGKHLISCSLDNTIILWETISGKNIYSFIEHKGFVNSVKFSPTGNYFASTSSDKTVILWKLNKKIFVDYYFSEEMEKEIEGNRLFSARKKSETQAEYKTRKEKARSALEELIDEYYEKYLYILNNQEF
jgi:WD40 repeat protein